MSSNDTISKTLIVALLLCVVCSVVVSTAAVVLKPAQEANKLKDKRKNILAAAGLLEDNTDIGKAFESIEVKHVKLETGEYVDVGPNFDQRKAAKDPATSEVIAGEKDIAGLKRLEDVSEVYLAKDDSGNVETIILPVRGYGLWSTLYGFLALKVDANTVVGLGFYEHGETPGLGGEVDNPKWKAQWGGKEVYNDAGKPAIHMSKVKVESSTPDAEHKFDALSGATLTSRGVENLIQFWTGQYGFGPYLQRVRTQGV